MSVIFGCHLALVSGLACLSTTPLPAPAEVSVRLDAAIEAHSAERGIAPEELVGDAGFLRRAWLGLAGRVPSPLAVRAFLDDTRSDKRAAARR